MPGAVIGGSIATFRTIVSLDADAQSWVNQVVNNGGTVSTPRSVIISDLISGLKTDGVWSKLDRLWIFAAENQPSALTDVVARDLATSVNSTAFSADDGYTGSGASYIDTNYNPTSDAINYTQNAASFGFWQITSTSGNCAMGLGDSGTVNTCQFFHSGGDTFVVTINNADASSLSVADAFVFWDASRTASNAREVYNNGTSINSDSGTSSFLPNLNYFVIARNNNGSAGNQALDQYAAAVIGGALDDTDNSNLYNRLRTYMTAVGVP